MDPDLIQQAHDAIAKGADPQKVAARFRELSGGQDLPSPAVAAGQIEPPGIQKITERPDAASFPRGSPTNPTAKPIHTDAVAGALADLLNPVNAAIGAGAMAIPVAGGAVAGPLSRILLGGGTAAAIGGSSAAQSVPSGQRIAAGIKGAEDAAPLGLGLGLGTELGVGTYGALKDPARVRALLGDVKALRDRLSGAENTAADVAAQAQRESSYRTGTSGLPNSDAFGIDAAHGAMKGSVEDRAATQRKFVEQGITDAEKTAAQKAADETAGAQELERIRKAALGETSDAMKAGVEANAAARTDYAQKTAGIDAAKKIRDVTGINEPVDVMQQKVQQAKRQIGAEGYGPLEGPVDDPAINDFIKAPEFARDLRAVAPDVAAGKRPIEFSELQDLRNRWRSGNFQDKQAVKQLSSLMENARPGLTANADAPYAIESQIGRAQNVAQKAGAWKASKIRTYLSSIPEPAQQAFKQTYVENNVIQDILKKESGAPALASKLGGGPQMDERLQAVLSPDEFQQVKQIMTDHNAALAAIQQEKNIALAKLGTQSERAGQDIEAMTRAATEKTAANKATTLGNLGGDKAQRLAQIEQQRAADLSRIESGRNAALQQEQAGVAEAHAPLERIRGLKNKVDVLTETQKQLQAQADQTARKIKAVLGIGAGAAAGWEARQLYRAFAP